ncbi:TrkH family potassium uptake protein [Laspinema olomoucense]|uniref:TrkH family potassium uptake protein n=1 Tax=Laspinema olomoucense D3b TaxID=2953688 RepID=A0ABT2NB49_9CYAN|nr:TrkH family potassium uptake protein [Laspinema sp. D3b]MCT7979787.1 TrkH family potassium uptake protein [Laspinema sp. D3b]
MTVARTICLGFLVIIAIGTILLLLPISSSDGTWDNFVTALFTATSAVCVTGLVVVDTGTHYSGLGQFFIILLIQLGGLGYMTVNTFLLLLLGRRLGLRDRVALQQSLDTTEMSGVVPLVRSILAMTLIFELTGTFLLLFVFTPDFGLDKGFWLSIFHSVSAFNNAGFSLFADNLIGYAGSIPVNLVITLLVIFGGIGYQVIMEMYMWVRDRISKSRERVVFSLHFKIVTSTTLILLVVGTLGLFFTESQNPETLKNVGFLEKLLSAWFQSVISRTAGFNSINIGEMTTAALFIIIALMFIGASPGSTGGGIKTTTVRVLASGTRSVLQGRTQVLCFDRQIPPELILKAVAVVVSSLGVVVLATLVLTISDPKSEFIALLFEVVSAFATVGLSMGITADLSTVGQLVLIVTMYVGRVGMIMLMSAIIGDPKPSNIRYPEENLLVG